MLNQGTQWKHVPWPQQGKTDTRAKQEKRRAHHRPLEAWEALLGAARMGSVCWWPQVWCPLCSPQLSTLPQKHETDCPQRLVLRSPILQKSGPWLRALKPLFHLSVCQRRTRKISQPLEKDATKESIKSSSAGRRQRCVCPLYLTAPPLPHEKAAFLYRQQHAIGLEA